MRYLISALFALMVPILSVVALAVALSYGETGVSALLASVVGYGLLTEWHVRRRADASSLLEKAPPGWLLQLLNLVSSHGELEFAIGGRIRWTSPSDGYADDHGSTSGVQGKIRVHVRGGSRLSAESSRLGQADIPPDRYLSPQAQVESPRVLIVMDDKRYLALVSELLQLHGSYVVLSSDSNRAVDTVDRERPDAVVLDLDVEGRTTGRTILEFLSLAPSTGNLPIIGLTWNAALSRGGHTWHKERRIPILRKPFVPGDLYELVDAATASSGIVNPQVDWRWSFESASKKD